MITLHGQLWCRQNNMGTLWPSQRNVSCSNIVLLMFVLAEQDLIQQTNQRGEMYVSEAREKGSHGKTWLLIGCFTGIDPITVNIHWLGQICGEKVKGHSKCWTNILVFNQPMGTLQRLVFISWRLTLTLTQVFYLNFNDLHYAVQHFDLHKDVAHHIMSGLPVVGLLGISRLSHPIFSNFPIIKMGCFGVFCPMLKKI